MDFTAIKAALEGISDLADGVNASFKIFTDLPRFIANVIEGLQNLGPLTEQTSSAFDALGSSAAESTTPAPEAAQ